jgi:hypothetical protein
LGHGDVCGSPWETSEVIEPVAHHEQNGRQDD